MRCLNWSPGNEYRCEQEQFHEGEHTAKRPKWTISNPGYVIHWTATPVEKKAENVIDLNAMLEPEDFDARV
jgi:hypothetical protein